MPTPLRFVSPDAIRKGFSKAMSDMYREEVPLYGALLELVAETNARVLGERTGPGAPAAARTGEIQRLGMERHGAIRLGTACGAGDYQPPVCGDGHATGGVLRPHPRRRAGALHRLSRRA
jgi:hypothetical protein